MIFKLIKNAGRIEVPLLSTESRTIPPYHIAFIQVKTPSSLSSDVWEASVSGIRRHIIAANSLVRVKNKSCLIQVINCSSKFQVIYPGQHVAAADLYDDDTNDATRVFPLMSLSTTASSLSLFSNAINSSDQTLLS